MASARAIPPMLLATMLVAATVGSATAQSPEPSVTATSEPPSSTDVPARDWSSGDELRRELQEIGFAFRIDGSTGDWLGWTSQAAIGGAPALELDGAGTEPAAAAFQLDLLGGDPSLALTSFYEVATRLPLAPTDVEETRRFVVEDLLELPPETLEPCYVTDWERGAVLVSIDAETSSARIALAETAPGATATEIEVADCAPLIPSELAAELGDPSSERVTITLGGDPPAFQPSEVTLEGALVTVVLTFRNESDQEQTLTFAEPLESATGPVPPGEVRLIVVRQLQPGEYPFFSETDPEAIQGTVSIEPPTPE